MLLDLLNPTDTLTFNINLARTVGLNSAVYCAELLTIYKKASNKKKLLVNDYIVVDRNYIQKQTTLTPEDQLVCDSNLSKIGLISRDVANVNIIKLDLELLANLIMNDNTKTMKSIYKKVTVSTPKTLAKDKIDYTYDSLKNLLRHTNPSLREALCDWLDALKLAQNYITAPSLKVFEDTLDDYSKGDILVALEIVKCATVHNYADCVWAIQCYERNLTTIKKLQQNSSITRGLLANGKATKEDLSKITF